MMKFKNREGVFILGRMYRLHVGPGNMFYFRGPILHYTGGGKNSFYDVLYLGTREVYNPNLGELYKFLHKGQILYHKATQYITASEIFCDED